MLQRGWVGHFLKLRSDTLTDLIISLIEKGEVTGLGEGRMIRHYGVNTPWCLFAKESSFVHQEFGSSNENSHSKHTTG